MGNRMGTIYLGYWYEIYNSSNAAHSFCELSIIKKRSRLVEVWSLQRICCLAISGNWNSFSSIHSVLFLLGLFCPNHYDCFIPQSKNMEVNKIAEADRTQIQNTECV